ncbi:MAG: VOC family protein [Gammaproteobacteria bacterium]
MLHSEIDHIAISAPSLEIGVEYVSRTLGVSLQRGGDHTRMGTHNALLKLGESRYLEVIAINPKAAHPGRPRWFQLDNPNPKRAVRLATWIARTNDIRTAAITSPIDLGEIEPMNRDALQWEITIPPDGSLPMQGIAPTLIQWPIGMHPAENLPESGCRLVKLEGFHPQAAKIGKMLEAIGFDGPFNITPLPPKQAPYLVAEIQTPMGLKRLSTPTEF